VDTAPQALYVRTTGIGSRGRFRPACRSSTKGGGSRGKRPRLFWLRAGTCQVSVVDLTGRTVQASTGTIGTRPVLQLRQLPAGAYVVLVRGASVQLSRHLVKE